MVTRQKVYPSGPDDFRGASERLLVAGIALSGDDAWLAAQGARGSVTVWDLHKQELLLALPEGAYNWGLAWSPNRELLAASFSDGSLVVWNIPRIREQLAKIGLDWQDPALPAARHGLVEAESEPPAFESARLLALEVWDPARATQAIEGNVCRIDVTAVDGTKWHARLTQVFGDLHEGATYTIRFRAKADPPRPIVLHGQIDQPDWKSIGLNQVVALSTDWQVYQYEFRPKNLAAWNAIHFLLGERTGTVWIADFTVAKATK